MFNGHALVSSSTTLGHQSALPVLATEKDALVLDHQVHTSVHLASKLVRSGGGDVRLVKHGHLEKAYDLIQELSKKNRRVWFACDGVYSMFGDLAPISFLYELLDIAPNVFLYVDDAHGMSWAGEHGRGKFSMHMPMHDRLVLATSLNKAFSAAGGCIVFPSADWRRSVETCGGPQMFSGPIQPPMVGAALASAKLHLSDEIYEHQALLQKRVAFTNETIKKLSLPLLVENDSPIFFIRMGAPKVSMLVAEKMLADGYFVNISVYPSVPMKRSGLRLAITALHSEEEIEGALRSLARCATEVMEEHGVTRNDLDNLFATALPRVEKVLDEDSTVGKKNNEKVVPLSSSVKTGLELDVPSNEELDVELDFFHATSILDVDEDLWNRTLGVVGACNWETMRSYERVFSGQELPENNWDFHYVVMKHEGKPICVTMFTCLLSKDDMLSREEISKAVESKRNSKDDPYFLTSKALMMGTMCSEGNHLFLDRTGPWRAALMKLIAFAERASNDADADRIIFRDLPGSDPQMDAFFVSHGFLKVPMLPSQYVDVDWEEEDGFLDKLDAKKRWHARRYTISLAHMYEVDAFGPMHENDRDLSDDQIKHLYQLYRNVAQTKFRLNVFPLPYKLFVELLHNPSWETVVLRLKPSHGGPEDHTPVAFFVSHIQDGHYTPFVCGLDYNFVENQGAYRQVLYQIVKRAKVLQMDVVHFGMDAEFLKRRLSARPVELCSYVQVNDHYNGIVLNDIISEVGLRDKQKAS
tara:strand:+ start:5268 stop:7532 length:2265 start_codon:yes stop_codon:yes gene_type:complete